MNSAEGERCQTNKDCPSNVDKTDEETKSGGAKTVKTDDNEIKSSFYGDQ